MKSITYKIKTAGLSAAMLAAAACTQNDIETPGSPADGRYPLEVKTLSFKPGTSDAGTDGVSGELHACIFRNGILEDIQTGLRDNGAGYYLTLDEMSGKLYILSGTESILDLESLRGISEDEWKETVISGQEAVPYLTGMANLDRQGAGNYTVPVTLTRGVARFDLQIWSTESLSVNSVTFRGIRQDAYLIGRDPAVSPSGARTGDVTVDFTEPADSHREGIAYVYEQAGQDLSVNLSITAGGKTYEKEARLPESLKRNTAYAIVVNRNVTTSQITVEVIEWDREDSDIVPDFGSAIKVDTGASLIPDGVQVSEDGRTVTLPYTDVDLTLAVDCSEELEFIPDPGLGLEVEAVMESDGTSGTNTFRIRKDWWRLGIPGRTVNLQFRRKGLDVIYPDDRISMVLAENPVGFSGLLDFSRGNSHDFGKYIDNEFGRLYVPSDRTVAVEFAPGEDPWIKLATIEDEPGILRVIGGWKPNDRTADGRKQSATLVISDSDGTRLEEYVISRRNWGLPVTWLNGIWWCKYNAMGNSREFSDQILSSADPAAMAGKTVYEYLQTCSPEEYYDLWKWEYQGDSVVGLEVKDIDGVAGLEGFRSDVKVHMNTLDPRHFAPDGYETPSFDDFGRIFHSTSGGYIWIMWDGSHISPWDGGTNIQRRNKRRNDVTVGSVQLEDLFFMSMYKNGDTVNEPVVFYGAGSQWDNSGVKHGHYNNILFTVYSPQMNGWYFIGPMHALYLAQRGGGVVDSRILRFRKSDVEYIYGI